MGKEGFHGTRVVSKWQQVYSSYLEEHKLPQGQFKLDASIRGTTLTNIQMEDYKSIIVLRTIEIQRVEHKCRKLKTGNVPFSPILENDRGEISLWTAVCKKKLGCKASTRNIIRLDNIVGI